MCYLCGKYRHKKLDCPELATKGMSVELNFVFNLELKPNEAFVNPNGAVNDQRAEVTLGTGCSTVVIHPMFLPDGAR